MASERFWNFVVAVLLAMMLAGGIAFYGARAATAVLVWIEDEFGPSDRPPILPSDR